MPSRHQDLTFNQLKIFYEEKGKLLNANFAKMLDFLTSDGKYNQLAFLFTDLREAIVNAFLCKPLHNKQYVVTPN